MAVSSRTVVVSSGTEREWASERGCEGSEEAAVAALYRGSVSHASGRARGIEEQRWQHS